MSRRSRNDSDFFTVTYDILSGLPWWGGPPFAALIYAGLAWGLPALLLRMGGIDGIPLRPGDIFASVSVALAPFITGLVIVMWLVSLVPRLVARQRVDRQSSLEGIDALSWQHFEALLAEAFRRRDYRVAALGGTQPDGGVDLKLSRDGETTLVQCKHWKTRRVGVKVVRELMGVVAGQGADRGIVVTSGDYTEEARAFAASVPVTLIDGPELWRMIQNAQGPRAVSAPMPADAPTEADAPQASASPACPVCGREMVRRVARKGAYAGNAFWGCPAYPKCRGIVNG